MADKDVKMDFDISGLDEAMRKLGEEICRDLFVGTTSPEALDRMFDGTPRKRGCSIGVHEWATYNSGFTMYDYCKLCDKKRE